MFTRPTYGILCLQYYLLPKLCVLIYDYDYCAKWSGLLPNKVSLCLTCNNNYYLSKK